VTKFLPKKSPTGFFTIFDTKNLAYFPPEKTKQISQIYIRKRKSQISRLLDGPKKKKTDIITN
jgi:hypothetical protein